MALYLALTSLVYRLFRPISRPLSLFAVLFSIAGCVIQSIGDTYLPALQALSATSTLGASDLRSLATLLLAMRAQALHTALVLFGCFDILLGILIVRSRLLPRFLGVLMGLAGLGWLAYLWPPLADHLAHVIQPLGFLAEFLLMLWLFARGVNEPRWRQLAASIDA